MTINDAIQQYRTALDVATTAQRVADRARADLVRVATAAGLDATRAVSDAERDL